MVLKVRYGDFTTLTKRITLTEPTRDAERINRSARHIFQEIESINKGIRLLGVTMTNFVDHTELPLVEEQLVYSLVVFFMSKKAAISSSVSPIIGEMAWRLSSVSR